MTDLDQRLYDLLERCKQAGLPIAWCTGDTDKWTLVAVLRKQLADAEADDGQEG